MKRIKFLGAAGTVTGSSYHLFDGSKPGLLIDLGMFLGTEDIVQLNEGVLELDASGLAGAVLTHAHLDHCGRLPMLVEMGFEKTIYMTAATRKLLELTLFDAVKVARMNQGQKQLFDEKAVEQILKQTYIADYGQTFNVGQYAVRFRDAGHILGSATVEIEDRQADDGVGKIVFSGDLGNSPQDIVKPTEMIEEGNVVVMETTYGDRLHGKEKAAEVIAKEVMEIGKTEGVLLIPAFSLQRTQELLHLFKHLKSEGKVPDSLPVFLDSPMAIKATKIYENFSVLFNEEMATHLSKDRPFEFPGLVLTYKNSESEAVDSIAGPKVIIAGSGMMAGGRILRHAARYLGRNNTRLLFVGYQGEETLGRELLEGKKKVIIQKCEVEVKAGIVNLSSMSAHADYLKLMDWLKNIQGVKKVFLTHGENSARESFREKIYRGGIACEVITPDLNDENELA